MGFGAADEEGQEMRCRVCGGLMETRVTDLPFKIGDSSIVILKALPVLQCRQCGETELEHETMLRVDQVLAAVDTSSELEVIRFAA
jgi:YgiT-type zinc finger domain-containing protein